MPGIILYSYISIVLGMVLLLVGVLSRRRESRLYPYFLGIGGILLGLGLIGILAVLSAFGAS